MNPPPTEPRDFDARSLARRVWEERTLVAAVTVGAAVLALLVALLLPRWYRATAVILPPEETDLLSNLSFASRALSKFPAFGELGEYFTPADIYKAILKSRTVQDSVVDRFQLMKVYRQKSREKTLKALATHTNVKLAPDGTIAVAVEDGSPRRAADMANAMLDELDRYNIEKRNVQARRTREFLERRLSETNSLLRGSEMALQQYQESHHTVAPTSVASPDVAASANLMARKLMLQVRLGVLRSYLRENNEQVVQTRSELEQLENRIAALPVLQTELARLIRDNRVQEQLYLLLVAELEQARIQEQKDTPTVQVLDRAIPPERPSRPRRLVVTLAAAVLALLGSVVVIAVRPEAPGRA